MNVMHVETGRHRYGGAVQVAYLVRGLARHGIRSTLVCSAGEAFTEPDLGAEILRIPMRGDLDAAMIGRLARAIERIAPDLVHVHSRRGAELFAGLACRLRRRPAVLTRRVDATEPAWFARLKYAPYRRIVALSTAIETQLAAGARVDVARLDVIPSAVDTERFRPDVSARARLREAFGLPADALVAAVVAQLIPRKGHRVLLDGLGEAVRRHRNLHVLCFGRGSLEGPLRRLVVERRLEAQVRLAGFRDDLHRLLPGADVLVHPADREGLGVALLEAMSSGVPVVAAAAGGVVDILTPGVEGRLVPPGDRARLIEALDALLADPAGRVRMGAAGRARMEREHTIERMTQRYVDVYRRAARCERADAV